MQGIDMSTAPHTRLRTAAYGRAARAPRNISTKFTAQCGRRVTVFYL